MNNYCLKKTSSIALLKAYLFIKNKEKTIKITQIDFTSFKTDNSNKHNLVSVAWDRNKQSPLKKAQ